MQNEDDKILLRKWVTDRSHAAFRNLVQRYGSLVWGVVSRRLTSEMARQDAVQQVFVDLAQKAAELVKDDRPLGSWLHRSAVLVTLQEIRRESRRSNYMKQYAVEANSPENEPEAAWEAVLPHLDEAIQDLGDKDRQTVLARFYHGQTYAELATHWGESVAAVQRRGHRALEKLAQRLSRKKSGMSLPVLTAGLSLVLRPEAPAAMLQMAHASAVSAPTLGLGGFWKQFTATISGMKLAAAAAFVIGLAMPFSIAAFRPTASNAAVSLARTKTETNSPVTHAKPSHDRVDISALKRDFEALAASKDDAWNVLAFRLRKQMYDLQVDDIPLVYELLRSLPIQTRDGLSGRTPYHSGVEEAFYGRWAEENAAESVEAAFAMAKLVPGGYLSPLLRECFAKWMLEDGAAAWKWMVAHAKIRLDWAAVYPGLEAMEQTAENFTKSLSFVQTVPRDEDRRQMQGWLFNRWLVQDEGTASLVWAQENWTPAETSEALRNVISSCSQRLDRIQKMVPLIPHIGSPVDRHQALSCLMDVWLKYAPDKAMQALDELTPQMLERPIDAEGQARESVFSVAGRRLAERDWKAAVAAYRRLPTGPPQEAFLESMRAACPEDAKVALEEELTAQP